ncbi:MAG: hypothetical protein ACTSQD_08685, partial [Promethearchaeota archaeon]
MTETNKKNSLQSAQNSKSKLKKHCLYKILNPDSICVFGANNNLLNSMGAMQMSNIISAFKGKVYPIHPKLEVVQGLKAY